MNFERYGLVEVARGAEEVTEGDTAVGADVPLLVYFTFSDFISKCAKYLRIL